MDKTMSATAVMCLVACGMVWLAAGDSAPRYLSAAGRSAELGPLSTSAHLAAVWQARYPGSKITAMPYIAALYRYGGTIGVLGRLDADLIGNFPANASSPTPAWLATTDLFPTVTAGGDNDIGYVFTNSSAMGCKLESYTLPGKDGTPAWLYSCPSGHTGVMASSGNGELAVVVHLDESDASSPITFDAFTPNGGGKPFLNVDISQTAPKLGTPLQHLISFQASGPGVFVSDGFSYAIVSSFTGKVLRHGNPGAGKPIAASCGGGKYLVLGYPQNQELLVWADHKYSSIASLPQLSAAVASKVQLPSQGEAPVQVSPTGAAIVVAAPIANAVYILPPPYTAASMLTAHVSSPDGTKIGAFEPPAPNGVAAYIFAPGYDYNSSDYTIDYFQLLS
ncbi:uncharacterized protein AMSG_08316 [Thecamonas trahens ATCC 50062]|uniref:Uncharacterized protein n=1 Tax=Thecamonas trahens ATCC 50062 TaxID=461836 RepID=A0A0L0DJQ6_THETB|nr:hypothetical protein AMSG_08316 [Thecamonas trahens ATCC 50062]KNC52346.1 hypothetical protein AMSG_08316 [Thecamonas trahens ATCC 50062]|eukprot:XP_013755396.1 hypothetical protein AMSG_08316 [Thecamonas trahens ATCC 50062]